MDLERWGGELVRSWMKAWFLHVHSIYGVFFFIFLLLEPTQEADGACYKSGKAHA